MDDYSISDAELPTMVVRCNNTLVLRSVITGQHLEILGPIPNWAEENIPKAMLETSKQIEKEYIQALEAIISLIPHEEQVKIAKNPAPSTAPKEHCKSPNNATELPPCKVQRNYCCTLCSYYTQNPRSHLLHQRDVHGIRLSIHSCQHCQYASRYFQKLKRHIKMVHTVRSSQETLTKNNPTKGTDLKDTRDSGTKATGVPNNAETVSPLNNEQQPTMPCEDTPCCSKSINTQPDRMNIKKDPEAFFVAAYKKQLQKQLAYEERLKNFTKTFSEEQSKLATQCVASNPFSAGHKTTKDQSNVNVKLPYHVTEENSNVPSEHEKKRMFSCRKCNYVTHIKSRYNKHVKYHSMPMIQCDKCEFRTTYKWNLTRHLRSHHGNGIYKCSVCSFSAHMKQSLTSHEVNHHSPPVGRAGGGNKTVRRRRCRVGGSDLQPESHQQRSPKNSIESNTSDLQKQFDAPQSAGSVMGDGAAKGDESLHSTASSSNETELRRSQDSMNSPISSDTEHSFYSGDESDCKTSVSSETESDGFEDINNLVQNKLSEAPKHVDADILSDTVEISSSHRNSDMSLNNITSQESEFQNLASIGDNTNLKMATEENAAYTSESSSCTSTVSADEGFDKSSDLEFDSSSQSSYDSEDDSKSSSSSSIRSSDGSIEKNPKLPDPENIEK